MICLFLDVSEPGTSDDVEDEETNAKKFKSSKTNNKSIVRVMQHFYMLNKCLSFQHGY